jgi:hypothetical protein
LRNYFRAKWIKGEFSSGGFPIGTYYCPDCFGYDGNNLIQNILAASGPGATVETTSITNYVPISPALLLNFLVLEGPFAASVSEFAFNAIVAAENGRNPDAGSPREGPYGYKSEGGGGTSGKTSAGKAGTLKISLLSYLLLLLNTWQNVQPTAPKRWIDWLTLLISHYGRYTPTQIYGFLARVDFSGPTFKV